MFEIDASEAWDIDDEIDFTIVDTLARTFAASNSEPPDNT
jgi:CMP-N-acetylneuraminic acid synthetase